MFHSGNVSTRPSEKRSYEDFARHHISAYKSVRDMRFSQFASSR